MAVDYETEEPLAPQAVPGPYRAAGDFALPDEPRCELLFGSLFVTAAPKVRHQQVLFRLAELLGEPADHSVVHQAGLYRSPTVEGLAVELASFGSAVGG